MDAGDVKLRCSIRGRVAFVLAISEQCVGSLTYSEKVHRLATQALEDAWKWEEGGHVSGDQLGYYLENAEEESLAVYGCNPPPSALPAMMAITSAMAYVIWHAYKKDGGKGMSATILEVDENVIDEVIDFAKKSPGFDFAFLDRLCKHLVQMGGKPDELGKPIGKASLLKTARNY